MPNAGNSRVSVSLVNVSAPFLSEMSVRLHAVEAGTERTVALFLSDGAGVADDAGRLGVLEYAAG